ncbi:MAG: zinc-dependent peptidase [Proteobacteria bacterium]|nr:zinc-dependent peptidase [Pseudomonadota bacterium]MBU4471955.1 zinc-dependent peptidase [Pseudomonadota bacterium]MCG2753422.1 zinc-dependent peptidase [Desulfobacteraceae bacterium]
MPLVVFFLSLGAVWAGYIGISRLRQNARRQKALARPFADAWVEILRQNLPPYEKLSDDLRRQLHQDIQWFLAEKSFEGCGGLILNDEIRVTIAAEACMLLLNRRDTNYPRLMSILVYPGTYVDSNEGLFIDSSKPKTARLGESWTLGTVVLAWDSVKRGALNFHDGHNVVLHEFAHQLDQEDGSSNGAPILEKRSAYGAWAKIFSKEFAELQEEKQKGKPSMFDKYGATNPAEFFAVVTEAFYEKPEQFRKKHPELYEELREYYKVDPIEWI